jgi:hypothetical protein
MHDPSHCDHVVRKMFDLPAISFHDDYSQAVISVQANVRRGQDVAVRVMLIFLQSCYIEMRSSTFLSLPGEK